MLIFFFAIARFSIQAQALCYFPDGKTVASGDSPCVDNGNSTCCGHGFACISNRLCELTSFVPSGPGQSQFVRGSCTDPSWNDPNCPSFCISSEDGDTSSGAMGLQKCTGTNFDEYYCLDAATQSLSPNQICDSNSAITFSGQRSVDCTGSGLHLTGTPTTVTVIGITSTTSSSSTIPLIIPTSSNSIQSSLSLSSPSSSPLSLTSTSSTSMSLPSPTVSNNPDTNKSSVALGAGIGVPLGVIAVAVIALTGWKLGRSSQKASSHSADSSRIPLQAVGQANDQHRQSDNSSNKRAWANSSDWSTIGADTRKQGYGVNSEGRNAGFDLRSNELSELPVDRGDPHELSGGDF